MMFMITSAWTPVDLCCVRQLRFDVAEIKTKNLHAPRFSTTIQSNTSLSVCIKTANAGFVALFVAILQRPDDKEKLFLQKT